MSNVTSLNRYNTAKNLSIQRRSGSMDGLLCASYGLHNDNGKTSLELNQAYVAGYELGKLQHDSDISQARMQAKTNNAQIKLALVA